MLKKLHENFKVIFGEESRESFFASARKFRLSEETSIDENLAYGTYAAAKERNDGMISVSFGEGKYTLPLDNLDSEIDLEFIASVVEAYKSCGYSIKKGLDIIYHMDVPTEEGYSKINSLKYATIQAFNRIEGFQADNLRILRMTS